MDNGLVQSHQAMLDAIKLGLNPYCSGQWSRTHPMFSFVKGDPVLILIVVDNGLVQATNIPYSVELAVLILIVVDNGLVLDLIRPY